MDLPIAGAPAPPARPTAPAPPAPSEARRQELDTLVAEHDLVLFMKGTPEAPMCGFSARAVAALQQLGRPFHAVNVFEAGPDPHTTLRELAAWADFPTLPQVWVKGELIGGSDVAIDMLESGELERMLA